MNIRNTILLLLLLAAGTDMVAQTTAADTTIYQAVEVAPRFPGCEQLDTTLTAREKCSQQLLLDYIYRRILYPEEARQQNIEGTAVVSFVVEPDGSVSNPSILSDPGGNIGLAALRAVLAMAEDPAVVWTPGQVRGKTVRAQYNLPVRFKLEDPKPYVMVGRDSIYVEFDTPLEYQGGTEALQAYLDENLTYPASGNDSCLIGQVDVRVFVRPDNVVRVLDIIDYNNLGFDFWYESISSVISTSGNWQVATFEGRPVPASFEMSLSFVPTAPSCQTVIDDYRAAMDTAQVGADLYNAGNKEEGIARMTESVNRFPNDAQLLILRGQAYLDNNQFGLACEDLSKARRIALVDWFDSVLPLICRAD